MVVAEVGRDTSEYAFCAGEPISISVPASMFSGNLLPLFHVTTPATMVTFPAKGTPMVGNGS